MNVVHRFQIQYAGMGKALYVDMHGGYRIDNDLFEGSSSYCATFGSPCLASSADFKVQALELWHLA